MDDKIFSILQEAARALDSSQDIDRLQNMQRVYDEGLYFVAFIGSFSSGKSSLINNVIGRKILPQGSLETTPILTYIRYGEDEKAILFFNDGTQQDINLENVAEIMQKNNTSDIDLNRLEHMEIYLKQDLFAQGLILMDTPGLNTIIKRHEQLLATSLALSSKIIYVTRGAIAKVDAEKLDMITKQGFNVSFVRTHCDEIKQSEESIDDVIKNDIEILKSYGLDKENCFHISNTENTPCYDNINKFKIELAVIGEDAKSSLEIDTKAQLKVFVNDYLERLKKIESILIAKKSDNDAVLRKQQDDLSKKIQSLTKSLEDYQEKFKAKINKAQGIMQEDINLCIDRSLSKAERNIQCANLKTIDTSAMESLAKRTTNQLLQELFAKLNTHIDPMIAEVNGTLSARNLKIESIELPDADNYEELIENDNAELEELREKMRAIRNDKEALEQIGDKLSAEEIMQLEQAIQEAQSKIDMAKEQYTSLGPYRPRMIEVKDGTKAADVGRIIGNALDVATFFIPQGAIIKAATKVGLVAKLGKAIGMAEKTVGIAQKSSGIAGTIRNVLGMTKTYETARRTQKALTVINTMQQGVSIAKASAPGLLDYLQLGYWGQKIGEQFDSPPIMTIDKEYERVYIENKRQIENEIKEQQAIAFNKKSQLGLYADEHERRAAKIKSLTVDEKTVAEKLRKRTAQIKAESEAKALSKWKSDCAKWYRDSIETKLRELIDDYLNEIPVRLENYQDKRANTIINKLNSKQDEYNKLIGMPPSETEQKLNTIKILIKNLNDVQVSLK